MAENMHDLLWYREKHEYLCTEYTGGRQSELSKCDSVGPSRHKRKKNKKSTWMRMKIYEHIVL